MKVLALGLVVLLAACGDKPAATKTPSQALVEVVEASRKGDVEGFKKGISKNFQLTIERYQEMGQKQAELKGAFEYNVFMNALAQSAPVPKEEMVKGDKAVVKVTHKDGRLVQTDMILEDGAWKIDVPPGMVKGLDHFDQVQGQLTGNPVEAPADIKTGGGGKGGRATALPANATPAQIAKATALDAFDLGDVDGSRKMMIDALKTNPDDAELTVALGRAHVQTGDVGEAVKLLEGHLQKDPKSVAAMHYLGMAYMFQKRPKDAAAMWRKVGETDAAYSKQYKLDERAAVAEQMEASAHQGTTQDGQVAPPETPAPDGTKPPGHP